MTAVTKKRRRDYTGVFLGVVLAGLVVIVWGMVMVSAYSMSAGPRTKYLSQMTRHAVQAGPEQLNSAKVSRIPGTN